MKTFSVVVGVLLSMGFYLLLGFAFFEGRIGNDYDLAVFLIGYPATHFVSGYVTGYLLRKKVELKKKPSVIYNPGLYTSLFFIVSAFSAYIWISPLIIIAGGIANVLVASVGLRIGVQYSTFESVVLEKYQMTHNLSKLNRVLADPTPKQLTHGSLNWKD